MNSTRRADTSSVEHGSSKPISCSEIIMMRRPHLCDFDNGAFTVETQELERLNFESNRSTGTKEFQ